MSFIDDSKNNVNRLMEDVTGGDVGGFVGRAGTEIDTLFGGAYHPDSGHGSQIDDLLKQQIKDRKEKRKNLDSIEYGGESPIGGYHNIHTPEAINTYKILYADNDWRLKFNQDVTPIPDDKWRATDKALNMIFDEPGEAYKVKDLKYDDNSDLYAGDTYINKSKTNWKYINTIGDK